ncbi:MAG: alpha/beta fold hydrolase [Actinophytocola sp.]|nr:alpha/beta fold hydrolase [Actinophytocola sp.]
MSKQRTHYVTTTDGVTIGATVHGQGPPLVFVQGVIGDGDLDWGRVAEHLSPRFTCHLPSLRGRGLSGDHPDLNIARLRDDLLTYVDSIGEPTGLVGWSLGAGLALLVAAQSDAVTAVAPLDPLAVSMMEQQERAALGGAVARAGELAAAGRLADAVRAFAGYPFNDKDIAVADDAGYFEASGRYVQAMGNFFRQQMVYEGPMPDDPAVLNAISAPMLVLHGSDTTPFGTFSARYVADHVPHARVQAIPGAGHAASLTHPEPLAEALAEFFTSVRQPA